MLYHREPSLGAGPHPGELVAQPDAIHVKLQTRFAKVDRIEKFAVQRAQRFVSTLLHRFLDIEAKLRQGKRRQLLGSSGVLSHDLPIAPTIGRMDVR